MTASTWHVTRPTGRDRAERALRRDRARARVRLDGAVGALVTAMALRDPYTAAHQRRVAEHATAIATELGLDAEAVVAVRVGARLHDVGKIAVPAEILHRPAGLTRAEHEIVQDHARNGHDIVDRIGLPWPVARMVLEHHERMDGSGYPLGLAGDGIHLGSRIIAVADVLDAVAAERPYRPPQGLDAACDVLLGGRGALFDAEVVDACLRSIGRSAG